MNKFEKLGSTSYRSAFATILAVVYVLSLIYSMVRGKVISIEAAYIAGGFLAAWLGFVLGAKVTDRVTDYKALAIKAGTATVAAQPPSTDRGAVIVPTGEHRVQGYDPGA